MSTPNIRGAFLFAQALERKEAAPPEGERLLFWMAFSGYESPKYMTKLVKTPACETGRSPHKPEQL